MRIYKRKQESKKKERKHALDQADLGTDQEKSENDKGREKKKENTKKPTKITIKKKLKSFLFSWSLSWSRAYFLPFFLSFMFSFINSHLRIRKNQVPFHLSQPFLVYQQNFCNRPLVSQRGCRRRLLPASRQGS